MLIRFMGPEHVRRIVGEVEWSQAAGVVQDVDAALAVALLTTPGEMFEVDQAEPLLGIVGDEDTVVLLAMEGVGSAADLAALTASEAGRVARSLGLTKPRLRAWQGQAVAISADEAGEVVARAIEEGRTFVRRG